MTRIEELYQYFKQFPQVTTDSRQAANGKLFFALKGEKFDGNQFAAKAIEQGAELAIVDDKEVVVSDKFFLVDDVLEALQQLANHHRHQLNIPVIAITGTNGKTTTKELVSTVLEKKFNVLYTLGNFNNHIGVPLTLLRLNGEHEIAVIEMGANHPGEIAELCEIAAPNYGMITNVGKAHLEGFGSFEGVKKTKSELYRYLESNGGKIFLNADNAILSELANGELITYGSKSGNFLQGELISGSWNCNFKVLFPKGWLYMNTNLVGAYNFENGLAASCIGHFFEVDALQIQKALANYKPENMRSQYVKKSAAHLIIDTYNANPTSMLAALNHFISINGRNKCVILGDMLELGEYAVEEHQKVVDWLLGNKLHRVILVGKHFVATSSPKEIICVESAAEVKALIDKEPFTSNDLVLIKGSRGIKLEQLVDMIQ
ncbi:UDP-N-acetylmuramoyl-tripeptide--D-alanyl-D-alanine ligase [Prolixibacteraceae bacterium JC049]|nr:UDP-N-acetylmuramoyl-tripeptide--D-alanyl-D-alanine ligase [Prolixibacteraceae bacterium JC049]